MTDEKKAYKWVELTAKDIQDCPFDVPPPILFLILAKRDEERRRKEKENAIRQEEKEGVS